MGNKKVFFFLCAVFVALIVYIAFDLMMRTTPPWKKKKVDESELLLYEDSLQKSFSDTIIYTYKVRKNDALSTIAQRFNFKKEGIKTLNQLTDDTIIENQKLKIRVRAIHQVQKSEFVEKIARQYKVDVKSILAANHIDKPYQLRADQKLVIPLP